MLKIAIDLENDAFQPEGGRETARILRKLADQMVVDGDFDALNCSVLMDVNGNMVGEVYLFDPDVEGQQP